MKRERNAAGYRDGPQAIGEPVDRHRSRWR
jgi:hypothetical protein